MTAALLMMLALVLPALSDGAGATDARMGAPTQPQSPAATAPGVRVATFNVADPDDSRKVRALVAADVECGAEPSEGPAVTVVVRDAGRRPVAERSGRATRAADQAAPCRFLAAIPIAPGLYDLQLDVARPAGKETVEAKLDARLPTASVGVVFSDLLLADPDILQGGPLRPDTGTALRNSIASYIEVYDPVHAVGTDLEVYFDVARDQAGSAVSQAPATVAGDAVSRRWTAVGVFDLSRLSPGDYVARALVSLAGQPVKRLIRPFRVAPSIPVPERPVVPALESRRLNLPATPFDLPGDNTDGADILQPLLRRAGRAVVQYVESAALVVGEEHYVQETYRRVMREGSINTRLGAVPILTPERENVQKTQIVSEFILVQTPEALADGLPWMEFRDVASVDGKAVRDRDERLARLFLNRAADTIGRARAMAAESARFNMALAQGTLNLPGLALLALHPLNQGRFAFKDVTAQAAFGAPQTIEVSFVEIRRPTLARSQDGRDSAMEGRVWINPANGSVVKTMLRAGTGGASSEVTAVYRRNAKTGLILVAEMFERAYDQVSEMNVDGHATYGNYRRFETSGRIVDVPTGEIPAPDVK